MREIIDYYIIKGSTSHIVNIVKEMRLDGWKVNGDLKVSGDDFIQVVVKYDPNPNIYRNVVDYMIVDGSTFESVKRGVMELINDGYFLYGSLGMSIQRDEVWYCQAMVKYKDELDR